MTLGYAFPMISNIKDVMVAVSDDFRVVEKGEHTFINYNTMIGDAFPPVEGDNALIAALRREFRGITFNTATGDIVSRPYHKFFNFGERSDVPLTAMYQMDKPVILEKIDGSMIRPIIDMAGDVRWFTKMGLTDVGMAAESFAYFSDKKYGTEYYALAKFMVESNCTPLFEYTSPDTRIVVPHESESMVLLDIRANKTGAYYSRHIVRTIAKSFGITPVDFVDHLCKPTARVFDLGRIVQDTKERTDGEGVVIVDKNGHRGKLKADDYVRLHRAKDRVKNERRVMEVFIEEQLDDLIPLLSDFDKERVTRVAGEMAEALKGLEKELDMVYNSARQRFETKRDYAVSLENNGIWVRGAIFTLWDGKQPNAATYVKTKVLNGMKTERGYEEMKKELGIHTTWVSSKVDEE